MYLLKLFTILILQIKFFKANLKSSAVKCSLGIKFQRIYTKLLEYSRKIYK